VKLRELVYMRARWQAQHDGRGEYPICPHCDKPVRQPMGGNWHSAHIIPRALGGRMTVDNLRPAHPRCNLVDGRRVTSLAAKGDRIRRKHAGTWRRPRHPIPGSRCTRLTKSPNKPARLRADVEAERGAWRTRMALRDADGNPVGVWAPER
jgi:HNH endonuclease